MNGYASFSCYGDAINFVELSRLLKPDSIRLKGAKRADGQLLALDVWTYSSRQKIRQGAPDKPLDYLLRKIYSSPKALVGLQNAQALGIERKTIGMLLNVNGSHGSFRIALRHIKFAALLNADLWFDCWRTKPRSPQGHESINWGNFKKGDEVTISVETDFENCDVHFTSAQIQCLAELEIEPVVNVW